MMLKNTTNSRKVGHNLQRKVLNDATNSEKEDHDLQRKVLKDAGNSREVDLNLVHLTMMLKKHQLKKSRSQSPKKSPERCRQLRKRRL